MVTGHCSPTSDYSDIWRPVDYSFGHCYSDKFGTDGTLVNRLLWFVLFLTVIRYLRYSHSICSDLIRREHSVFEHSLLITFTNYSVWCQTIGDSDILWPRLVIPICCCDVLLPFLILWWPVPTFYDSPIHYLTAVFHLFDVVIDWRYWYIIVSVYSLLTFADFVNDTGRYPSGILFRHCCYFITIGNRLLLLLFGDTDGLLPVVPVDRQAFGILMPMIDTGVVPMRRGWWLFIRYTTAVYKLPLPFVTTVDLRW